MDYAHSAMLLLMKTITCQVTEADIPYLIMLVNVMRAESSFFPVPFDAEVLALSIIQLLDDRQFVMVAETNGQIVGVMLGVAVPFVFSHALMAQDVGLFLYPKTRGQLISVKLVKAFERWAKEHDCFQVRPAVSSGGEAACRLYGLLSYVQAKWDADKKALQLALAEAKAKYGETKIKVVTECIYRVQVLRVKGDTIIKEAPKSKICTDYYP